MPATSRIESIDVIRGIAIMGILLVNAPSLNGPPIKDTVDFAFQSSLGDYWYSQIIFFLAVEKFYPIFALLFGISMSLFLSNKPKRLFIRRQMMLFFIGCAHVALVWWGDILTVYSVLGLLLVPLVLEAKKILKIIGLMCVIGLASSIAIKILPVNEVMLYEPSSSLIYSTGNFAMVAKLRVADFFGVYFPGLFYELNINNFLSSVLYFWQLMLLLVGGYYLNSSGWVKKLTSDKAYAFKAAQLTFALTFLLTILSYSPASEIFLKWQSLLQALFYASLILLWCHSKKWPALLSLLANVGRMSLSNYLFHTTSLSLLFYGYGFGLYGRIGPLMQLPIVLSLMVLSVIFSNLWLKYFNYGPIEWLWRSLTYGQSAPIKKILEMKQNTPY